MLFDGLEGRGAQPELTSWMHFSVSHFSVTCLPRIWNVRLDLRRDERDGLVLTDAGGIEHRRVRVVRLFPLSDATHWISLCDARGRELAAVEDVAALPDETRELLLGELASQEFRPVIRRIVAISARTTPSEWHVETDRGPTRFLLGSDDDVRPHGPHGLLIIDAHGIHYFIPDIRQLDSASRRYLNQML
jgi:Domain of unknown function (DUF1854)